MPDISVPYDEEDRAIPMKPVFGHWSFVPGIDVPIGGSPDMLNCVVRGNVLTKRPGYVAFPAGMSALDSGERIVGLFSTQDSDDNTYIYAATKNKMHVILPAASAWTVVTGAALTGSDERIFQFEMSQNAIVFSQGVDKVQLLPFAGAYADLSANCPAAQYLTRFAGRLFLGRTLESAAIKPWRVRRSVRDDHTDWTGIGSGFHDLTEFPHHIKQIKKLRNVLVVYTEKSITIGEQTELADAPVRYDTQVTDIGLYLPYTVKGRNEIHRFVGNDDVYIFDGSAIESIGFQIRDELFPRLNINRKHMMFSEITFDSQEFLLFICEGSAQTPNKVWVNNFARQIWYPWSVNGPVVGCIHRLDVGITIDDVDTPIDANAYEIDAAAGQLGYPALVTGHDDGKIYRWGRDQLSDAGVTIPCKWSSKDFVPEDIGAQPNEEITMKQVVVRYKQTGVAATLQFQMSTDGGATWQGQKSVPLIAGTSKIMIATYDEQATGPQIRFKFENDTDDETFEILSLIPVFETPRSRMATQS